MRTYVRRKMYHHMGPGGITEWPIQWLSTLPSGAPPTSLGLRDRLSNGWPPDGHVRRHPPNRQLPRRQHTRPVDLLWIEPWRQDM